MAELAERWAALCGRVGIPHGARPGWQCLVALHATPPRAYHNLEHVADCLAQFDALPRPAETNAAIELALFWHDAVYDSRAKDNEDQSARRWQEFASTAGIAGDLAAEVARLIRLTDHRSPADDPAGKLIQDVDLSILGRDEAAFDDYERKIREEYGWVVDVDYHAGRAAFLRGVLDRPRIFQTPAASERFEAAARSNLLRSLARLTG